MSKKAVLYINDKQVVIVELDDIQPVEIKYYETDMDVDDFTYDPDVELAGDEMVLMDRGPFYLTGQCSVIVQAMYEACQLILDGRQHSE